jgi:membrane associated rhomboid family serine protease
MRDDYPRQRTSVVAWLLSATVASYVLQFVFLRWFGAGGMLESLFALSVPNLKAGKIWTLLTYGALHDTSNLLHIVANLLGLYFLGRVLEPMLGPRRFFWVYAGAIMAGGALWTATHWLGGGELVVGASAGVAGLFIIFACFYPNQPITFLLFFFLPVTLKPKYLAIALSLIELLGFLFYEIMGAVSPIGSSLAHSSHLGGMAAGWIYFRYLHNANWHLTPAKTDIQLPRWFGKQEKHPASTVQKVNVASREDLRAEVDRILDKINSHGFGSLTADEKRRLDEAKDLLSRR